MTGGGEQPARAPGGRRPWELLVSTGNLEYDRVLFFTDAIFAIAITLLVVDIRVPDKRPIDALWQLRHAFPQMLGFGISFVVIGTFWVAHHGIFRHIAALDRRLIWLNLFFAGMIAFLPYPTSLLSQAGDRAAVVFYAAWVAVAALAESAIWIYACRTPGAITAETPQWMRRYLALRMLRVPAVFLVSIPVAFASAKPTWVPFIWLAIAVLGRAIRRFAGPPREPAGSIQEAGEDGQAA